MAVRIEIPEDIEHHLETQWGNLPRHALEALAIEGYRARVLSRSQVRRMLGFETGVEVDEFMKRAGVPFDYTMDDRSEEHTSELQSRLHLVCRLLLEKKKTVPIALTVPLTSS